MSTSVKKPTLRQLAVEAGLAKPNDLKLFQMDIDGLIDLLKKDFPGIDEMDDDDVLELTKAEKKKGGGKAEEPKEEPRGRGRAKADEPKDEPRGRGRAKAEEPKEEPRGRGRAAKEEPKEESKEEPRGRGRGRSDDKEEPKEESRGRGRGAAADEKKEEPRGRGRGRGSEEPKEEPKSESNASGGGDTSGLVTLIEAVLGGQVEMGKRLDALEKSLSEIDAKVDAADLNNTKTLKGMKAQLAEVHVGVESIYLDDIDKKDKDLAAVLKRVSD
jgi:hypothetical protein